MRWRSIVLTLFLAIVLAFPAMAEIEYRNPLNLSVSAGAVSLEHSHELAMELILELMAEVDCWRRHATEPWVCWGIEMVIIDIPEPYPDPWRGTLVVDGRSIDLSDLRVGPALVVAPELELVFSPGARLHGSVFFGPGFMSEKGRETTLAGVGSLRTSNNVSPLITYGGTLRYRIGDRTALRVEARALTSFLDEMTVTMPTGQQVTVEGGTMTSPMLMAGILVKL